jgi:hypothetical protein
MKKGIRKLSLHRETLRALTDEALQEAGGGATVRGCASASFCYVCPTTPANTCGCGD